MHVHVCLFCVLHLPCSKVRILEVADDLKKPSLAVGKMVYCDFRCFSTPSLATRSVLWNCTTPALLFTIFYCCAKETRSNCLLIKWPVVVIWLLQSAIDLYAFIFQSERFALIRWIFPLFFFPLLPINTWLGNCCMRCILFVSNGVNSHLYRIPWGLKYRICLFVKPQIRHFIHYGDDLILCANNLNSQLKRNILILSCLFFNCIIIR